MDKATQRKVVDDVLKEMNEIDKIARKEWNASWEEFCSGAYSKALSEYDMSSDFIKILEENNDNAYDLTGLLKKGNKVNVPLKKANIKLGKNTYECGFEKVEWKNMKTNKAVRFFSFDNNGNIGLIKKSDKNTYGIDCNITNNDFAIIMNNKNHILVENNNDMLYKKYNDLEIIKNYEDGTKTVKIVKVPTQFEARFDSDDNLEYAFLKINKYKSNGKVNGTYRIDASWNKGIRANYYSRKGNKIDLSEDQEKLEEFSNLIVPIITSNNEENKYISSFIKATGKMINGEIDQNELFYENQYFNLDFITEIENRIDDELKVIKNEIPSKTIIDKLYFTINSKNANNFYDEYKPRTLKKKAKKQSHTR